MNSWWNSHQRHNFLRAEASRDILKFRVLEMAFPGVSKRYFPPLMPLLFHQNILGTMSSKCPSCSTTTHGSNVAQIQACLNMRSMSFKTGKRVLYNFIRWCSINLLAVMVHVEGDKSSWRFWPATGPYWQPCALTSVVTYLPHIIQAWKTNFCKLIFMTFQVFPWPVHWGNDNEK